MYVKSTVELVQVVGQTVVVSGVEGSGLVVGNLPEPSHIMWNNRSNRLYILKWKTDVLYAYADVKHNHME